MKLITAEYKLPTANSSAAFGPIPENNTIQPSGTAPRMGNTTLPINIYDADF